MEWKTVKLGDILKITGGQLYKGDLLGTGDNLLLGMGCVSFLEKFLMKGARQYGGDCLDKNIGRPGDIVLATRQQSDNLPILAMPAIIPEGLPAKKIIIGSNLYKVNVIDSDFDNRFIYWLLKTPEYVNYISSVKTGTTVKMITIKDVENYTFLCPPKESRDKISKLLWDLDDKIENNNRINRNLEAQAQALYKSWFVDFEPWSGKMPEDWKEYELGEFLPVKTGKKDANIASKIGTYPFFSCAQDILYTDSYSFDGNAILVAGNGDFNVKWYRGRFEAYQRTYVLIPDDARYLGWLFYAVKHNLDKITCGARGSVIKFITKGNLENFAFVAPKDLENCEIIDKFNIINANIEQNQKESQRLAQLRDTLLPKLMRGEIAV